MAQRLSGSFHRAFFVVASLLGCALVGVVILQPAFGLSAKKNEKAKLEQCEADICSLILKKSPASGWLMCGINKTWGKRDIKKGAKKKKIGWSFGDAQCTVQLKLERATVIGALSKPKFEIRLRRHYVNCVVENQSGTDTVHVALAPKLKFVNGRVKKIWVNVKVVDGPPLLSSLIWTTAKLEDGLGIFHGDLVHGINDFIHKKCEKRHGAKAKKKN